MGKMFTRTDLFSCPIYRIRIDPKSYDKEKIINDILYNKNLKNTRAAYLSNETHQIINSSVPDIHHSYLDFDNENFRIINYDKLVAVYHKIFEEFFNKELDTTKLFEFEFEIVNYSAITEGQSLIIHNHLPWDFSTTHYFNFKKDHVHTRFENPSSSAQHLIHIQSNLFDIIAPNKTENSYLYKFFTLPAKEDDMIIFPAATNHEVVLQGPTTEPRITISTNIRIK